MKKLFTFLGSLILTALLAISLHAQTTDVITVSGNWTAPVGVSRVTVEVWGGGGGGGATPGWWHTAGGGGGGAYAKIENFSVVGGNNYAVQIGTGGSGAYPTETAGGDSWFVNVSTCMAKGGGPGNQGPEHSTGDGGAYDGIAGTGGSAGSSVGTTKWSGGNGHTGYWALTSGYGGGGGSAAGTAAAGLNATGQSGANSPLPNPTGNGGDGHDFNGAGSPGYTPGGGGGGSRGGSGASSSAPGGAGARGEVRITYSSDTSDLQIVKTASPPPHYFGNNVVFTIVVTNLGPDPATNVDVTELLSDGFAYVSHSVTQGTYDQVAGDWDVGSIGFPGSATLTITATILPTGNYNNITSVLGDQIDEDQSDNVDEIMLEPTLGGEAPLSNWALFIGIGLIVAFMVIRFRRVL